MPDFSGAAVWRQVWQAGLPDTSKTWKEVLSGGPGVRVDAPSTRAVEALRCTTCGRLELFAREPPTPKEIPQR